MFASSETDGFRYKIERKENILKIWLQHPASGKSDFASIHFDGDEENISAAFRQTIRQIVFFTA